MNNKPFLYTVLCVLVFFVILRNGGCLAEPNVEPKPNNPVVVPEPTPEPPIVIPPPKPVPPQPKVLEDNFVYDDYQKAIELGKEFKKKIVVVFGADWCPYCVQLKQDAKGIKELEEYIVCFVDTTKKKENQEIINKFRPRSLPTSIIVDTEGKELSKHIGYKNSNYKSWLQSK